MSDSHNSRSSSAGNTSSDSSGSSNDQVLAKTDQNRNVAAKCFIYIFVLLNSDVFTCFIFRERM